jgi:site-specific DNA-methyltransferase (adenine-specific)
MKPDILTPFLDDADVILYAGDCVEVMKRMPGSSVDAIVTDPPYGLEFMGKGWDGFGTPLGFQTWTEAWAVEAFRILKPGGHLLAFAGTRTYHRMTSGVEDAGFEIRDCIAWMYGSGFPKSLDVSKAIDKAAGAEREVVGNKPVGWGGLHNNRNLNDDGWKEVGTEYPDGQPITSPATDAARKWNGWGTALKPAFEPIVVARRPLIGTVAANVLEHGTGALNIDACRIDMGAEYDPAKMQRQQRSEGSVQFGSAGLIGSEIATYKPGGRWPANIALDATAAAMLDEQSGERSAGNFPANNRTGFGGTYRGATEREGITQDRKPTDTGGASRFFYTAKASRQDRNVGGLADNTHPTVKPTDLMRWLIRLITPPGGIILDPFGGSGSTGLAARAENVRCILIEREPEYLQIIRDRLAQQNLFATETTTDAT